jgi:hypothetical protein
MLMPIGRTYITDASIEVLQKLLPIGRAYITDALIKDLQELQPTAAENTTVADASDEDLQRLRRSYCLS